VDAIAAQNLSVPISGPKGDHPAVKEVDADDAARL
jgi:hypothetical protein